MKHHTLITSLLAAVCCLLISNPTIYGAGGGSAPGVPGSPSLWNYAGKTGIGTSYEQYHNKQFSDSAPTGVVSKVWFSIAQGIVTETAWGMIHEAQIKDWQFLITGNGFFDEEKVDTHSTIEYLSVDAAGRPTSLSYKIVNTDKEGKYVIEKHVFTDPNRQALFVRTIFTANEAGITPYILLNPHVDNTGNEDIAYTSANSLSAKNTAETHYLTLKSTAAFVKTSAGFVGSTDGWNDLNDNGTMDWQYDYADNGGGNVALTAQLPTVSNSSITFDMVVGFGATQAASEAEADNSLAAGYATVRDQFDGAGSHIGWQDYISSLTNLTSMLSMTGDNGKQLYASALILKAMEDKIHAGALIASLSIPWGDTESADSYATGYRALWPRDFYQVAMAFLALGDTQTPLIAFERLQNFQTDTGWYRQKTRVDGTPEWTAIQLDQTAMPIMLGWKLWKAGILTNSEISSWYTTMLKSAADFLSNGGDGVTPPWTQQERWEEQSGHSPSTTAALITGLVAAADIAENAAGDTASAATYKAKADFYEGTIESYMYTTSGTHNTSPGNGHYFLRITQDQDPNDGDMLAGSNGKPSINEKDVLDAGFLELVRYGVRSSTNFYITDSLDELDDTSLEENLRVKYDFTFDGSSYPGWRRYGNDGYGERTVDGSNYSGGTSYQRGRVWPIFTGERGHYELARLLTENDGVITSTQRESLRDVYVRAIENFANEGLMIPEQVWDGVGDNTTHQFAIGEGTNSATPLAWSHAEYVKLVKSLTDSSLWDSNSLTVERYQTSSDYLKTFDHVYLRGTHNSWGLSAMELIDDYTWEISGMSFSGNSSDRFKFDIYGDWSLNYGDNEPNGTADSSGADIYITGGAGNYRITFNDSTKAYSMVNEGGMDTVAVTFTCNNGYTYTGQGVYVVGNQSELSNWSIASASASQKLDPNAYPSWSGTINLPANTSIEWKCVKREEVNVNSGHEWQSGSNNTLTTPASGSASTSGSF